jgi:uncharacterized membrane protein YeaQ/YmgE (transglycosylase-associated protein family)
MMLGAILLGFVAGVIARMLMPGDVFRHMSGPKSWLVSLGIGLLGALLGYLIFTVGLGIGDTDIFDWGGIVGAIIGTLIVLPIAGWLIRRYQNRSTAG